MATAPPTQKYRLQPIRYQAESHTETKEPSEGGAKLTSLRVDTSDATTCSSKSPLETTSAASITPKEGIHAARRRISEPSTSTAAHKDGEFPTFYVGAVRSVRYDPISCTKALFTLLLLPSPPFCWIALRNDAELDKSMLIELEPVLHQN